MTASIQAQVWANKVTKGFNTTDVPMEVALLVAEVGEFVDAWKRGQIEQAADEIADVAIFAYGLAGILGVDLDQAVAAKVRRNTERVYITSAHGHVERTYPPGSTSGGES